MFLFFLVPLIIRCWWSSSSSLPFPSSCSHRTAEKFFCWSAVSVSDSANLTFFSWSLFLKSLLSLLSSETRVCWWKYWMARSCLIWKQFWFLNGNKTWLVLCVSFCTFTSECQLDFVWSPTHEGEAGYREILATLWTDCCPAGGLPISCGPSSCRAEPSTNCLCKT